MKKNLSKTFLLIALFFLVSGCLFFLIGYQELNSLESEYTKEELFKLCSEGKVGMLTALKVGHGK